MGITFDTSGFDELRDKLENVSEEQSVSLGDLLSPTFLSQHTNFASLDDLVQRSGFKIESQEDLDNLPQDEWDSFIAQNSSFSTFQELLQAAAVEQIKKQLGF